MARPRGFDERHVVAAARELFVRLGYEATSVDDLVRATRLHRGSLYQAFASERGIFLAALHQRAVTLLAASAPGTDAHAPATLLGRRLLERATALPAHP